MSQTFSFDERVSGRYKQQREHPPEVARQIGETIAAEVGADARVLEIGIGTGRIALPVLTAGCHVTGIDLSPQMLVEVPDAASRLDLLRADMHHMPFVDASFNGVLAVHVMHWAKDWQHMLRECVRVLRPDGALIRGDDWIDPESVVGALRNELRAEVIRQRPNMMPPAALADYDGFLAGQGLSQQREVIAAEWVVHISPAERLQAVKDRIDAESWVLPPDLFDIVYQHLADYAAQRWPNLDEALPTTRRFILKIATREAAQS